MSTLLKLPRGRAHSDGRHDQVLNYHVSPKANLQFDVIPSLRRKPMALLSHVYRDKLFYAR